MPDRSPAQPAAPQGVAYAEPDFKMGRGYIERSIGGVAYREGWVDALEALRASNGQAPASRITVEQVEDAVGLQSTAWDTIGAEKIVEAVLRLANGQAPDGATNTKTHALLSMMIGLFLRAKEKIGYQPGSAIDKTVAEAVEHLKDWPYPETATAQAAPAAGAWIERWYGSGGKDGYEGWSIVNKEGRGLVSYLGRNVESGAVTEIVMAHNATLAAPTAQVAQEAPAGAVPEKVYLVATGLTNEAGTVQLYERHDKFVPLADCEVLYTTPTAQAAPAAGAVAGPTVPEGWKLVKQSRLNDIADYAKDPSIACYRGRNIYDEQKVHQNWEACRSSLSSVEDEMRAIREGWDDEELQEALAAAPTPAAQADSQPAPDVDLIARGMRREECEALMKEACAQAGVQWDEEKEPQSIAINVMQRLANAAHKVGFTLGKERMAAARAPADSQPAVQQWNDLIGKETHADADGLLVWRDEVDFAIPTPQADSVLEDAALWPAARDVLSERRRQVSAEGWTAKHDDKHSDGSLAAVAACYAIVSVPSRRGEVPISLWPKSWTPSWWKPSDPRRNLIKAGALILAELERIDRAARKQGGTQ